MSGGPNSSLICKVAVACVGLCVGFLVLYLPCFSQPRVLPLSGDLSISPPSVATAAFRLINTGDQSTTYQLNLNLPNGWQIVNLSTEVSISPQSSTLVLTSFRVPRNYLAGQYTVTLAAKNTAKPALVSQATINVKVKTEIAISLDVTNGSQSGIPGDSVNYDLTVHNRGNVETKLNVKTSSNWPVTISPVELEVLPGRKQNIRLTHKIPRGAEPGEFKNLYVEVSSPIEGDVRQSVQLLTEVLPPPPEKVDMNLGLPLDATFQWFEEIAPGADRRRSLSFFGSGNFGGSSVTFQLSANDIFYRDPSLQEVYLYQSDSNYTLELGDISTTFGQFITGNGRGISLGLNSVGVLQPEIFYLTTDNGVDQGAKLALQTNEITSSISWANLRAGEDAFNIFELSLDAPIDNGGLRANYASTLESQFGAGVIRYRFSTDRIGSGLSISYTGPHFLYNTHPTFDISLSGRYKNEPFNLWTNLYAKRISYGSNSNLDQETIKVGTRYRMDSYTRIRLEAIAGWEKGETNFETINRRYEELRMKLDQFWKGNSLQLEGKLRKDVDQELSSPEWSTAISTEWEPDLEAMRLTIFYEFEKSFYSPQNPESDNDRKCTGGVKLREPFSNFRPFLSVSLSETNNQFELSSKLKIQPSADTDLTITADSGIDGVEISVFAGKDFPLTYPWLKVKGQLEGYAFIDSNMNLSWDQGEKPLKGLLLSLNNTQSLTGENGKYRFVPSAPGEYELTLSNLSSKFVPLIDCPLAIELESGERKTLNIPVVEAASVTGRLVKFEDRDLDKVSAKTWATQKNQWEGEAVENVRIRISSKEKSYSTVTDKYGSFQFNRLKPGNWKVEINTDDLPSLFYLKEASKVVSLGPGEEKHFIVKAFKKEREIQELEIEEQELEIEEQ